MYLSAEFWRNEELPAGCLIDFMAGLRVYQKGPSGDVGQMGLWVQPIVDKPLLPNRVKGHAGGGTRRKPRYNSFVGLGSRATGKILP